MAFVGIDFSGARDAGKHIWICEGVDHGQTLHVVRCRPAAELPGSGIAREQCLPALVAWIGEQRRCVIACDVPFSLPSPCLVTLDWNQLLEDIAATFPTPEHLRAACRTPEGHERRRATDQVTHAPFGPGNLRLYRQTFYAIRDLLAPLVRAGVASVLPFHDLDRDRAVLIEACPAVTLRRLGVTPRRYKGSGELTRAARERILSVLEARGVRIATDLRERILSQRRGDALDSVIAAYTAWRAPLRRIDRPPFRWEGQIYLPDEHPGLKRTHALEPNAAPTRPRGVPSHLAVVRSPS